MEFFSNCLGARNRSGQVRRISHGNRHSERVTLVLDGLTQYLDTYTCVFYGGFS
jgi:hypothetical protein